MLRGKVKSAVRWATERTRGIVLSPSDMVDGSTTVMDARHPAPCPPLHCLNLIHYPSLRMLKSLVAIFYVLLGEFRGVLGLVVVIGMMLCCIMVLIVHVCMMVLSITPWNDVCALVSNRLIQVPWSPAYWHWRNTVLYNWKGYLLLILNPCVELTSLLINALNALHSQHV